MEEEFSRGTTEKVSADGHLTYLLITNLLWGSGDEGRSGQQASGRMTVHSRWLIQSTAPHLRRSFAWRRWDCKMPVSTRNLAWYGETFATSVQVHN